VPIARRLNEVISASNGTLHGFMASLLYGIEKLFTALAVAPNSYTKEDVIKLHEHVKSWTGNPEVKDRADGLLTMLNTPSPTGILKDLQHTGVITAHEAESWKILRPKVSYGKLVDVSDEDIWIHRGRLITMFHRLILRTINYRGPITDFSGASLKSVDFDWSDAQ